MPPLQLYTTVLNKLHNLIIRAYEQFYALRACVRGRVHVCVCKRAHARFCKTNNNITKNDNWICKVHDAVSYVARALL